MSALYATTLREKRSGRWLITPIAVIAGCLALPAAAQAGVKMSAGPDFPPSVTVGQAGLEGSITLEHTSDGAEGPLLATVCNAGECAGPSAGITLIPSCGAFNNIPACTTPDPGVFAIGPTATIAPGSSCGLPSSQLFDVTLVDPALGKVLFTPQGGQHVVLGPTGTPSAKCVIKFTFDVLKQPSVDFLPTTDGVQTVQVGSADLKINELQGFGRGTSSGTTVNPPPPPPPPPTPPPPPPIVGSSAPTSGTAHIAGQTGCAGRNFNVTVRGRHIRRVTFFLDGRRIRDLSRPNAGHAYRIRVRPGRLRRGTHRVVARTTFTAASGTPSRRLRVVFQRCSRAGSAPQFTG